MINSKQSLHSRLKISCKIFFVFLMILQANFSTAQSYCASQGSQPWQQWIANVQLNTLDNASEKCHAGVCGYSDFTELSTMLSTNQSYSISLSAGLSWPDPNANLYWTVWIDYNQDGDFSDAGENVVAINGNSPDQTASFSVPDNASVGATRMRVSLKKNAAAGACESFVLGEVEDYTVDIQDGGNTGGGDCSTLAVDVPLINALATDGVFFLTITNPNNVQITVQALTHGANATPLTWATAEILSNTSVKITMNQNTGADPQDRSGNVLISCYDGTAYTVYCDIYQTTPAGTCWTNEDAGYGLLASEIPLSTTQPSPYTFDEMIGVNQRSQAMNEVYRANFEQISPDDFITDFSSHVRAFHHHEKDYPAGESPVSMGATGPTNIANPSGATILNQYKRWKTIWESQGLDIDIIATLVNAQAIAPFPNEFPNKWWAKEQWGNSPSEIFENAKTYGRAFAETACPPDRPQCWVNTLEVGNEAWGYEDPETFKQVYRGMAEGLRQFFVFEKGLADDVEQWPMSIIPGAFQAFRTEGVIELPNGTAMYDQLGRRMPCDYQDYIQGVNVHPYGFVNEGQKWQYELYTTLDQEPENPRSLFQFVKNAVYWRNVNLPQKEAGNQARYKAKVYASEFGYGSETSGIFPGVGELTQGIYNLRSILMMGRLGVYRTSIYDSWDHEDGGYYGYGLYTDGGGDNGDGPLNPKSHYKTLKNFKNEVGNKRYLQALHDGDQMGDVLLYAYVLGEVDGTPTHLVVWDGAGMDYAVGEAAVNNQRNALTASGAGTNLNIDLSALASVTAVNTSGAKWLHDLPSNNNYTGASENNGVLNMNVSPIPIMIPLNGSGPACPSCFDGILNCDEEGIDCGGSCATPCSSGGDVSLSVVANPSNITTTSVFEVTLTLANNSNQQVNNINIDGNGLNYKNQANPNAPFILSNTNYAQNYGNYNYWTGIWNGFSLAPGEAATLVLELADNPYDGLCEPNIPVSATGTTSGGAVSDATTVSCGDGTSGSSLDFSVVATPSTISPTSTFEVTLTLANNTNQTATNVVIDGNGLNYRNQANPTALFDLSSPPNQPNFGNYNYWTAIWNGFSLQPGEVATLTLQLQLNAFDNECMSNNPLSAEGTSSQGNISDNTTVDCDPLLPRISPLPVEVVQLFPNPVIDELALVLKSDTDREINVQLINIHGQVVQSKAVSTIGGANRVNFNTNDIPAGLYYISIDGFIGKKKSAKFIKVRD